ncbi:MAG: hypothetical protein ACREQI_07885 [Candidatus Binataceae bacterium]
MLMLNRDDQLILAAGRTDWQASGSEDISLRIDAFEIAHLQATAFDNLVLLPVRNGAVLKRLKTATDLYWLLPSGTYHATVSGLGDALEWVRRCERRKRLGLSSGS